MKVKKVNSEKDLLKCSEVILELRPHLKRKDLCKLYAVMKQESFQIVYIEEKNKAVAFAGYRYYNMFFSGKTLYIDDLCTLPEARGKGHAGVLLDHIKQEAKTNKCNVLSLDSGHKRYAAHRLYLNKGFAIEGHHFHMNLN